MNSEIIHKLSELKECVKNLEKDKRILFSLVKDVRKIKTYAQQFKTQNDTGKKKNITRRNKRFVIRLSRKLVKKTNLNPIRITKPEELKKASAEDFRNDENGAVKIVGFSRQLNQNEVAIGMDAACGLMTLHIGDRILEINGTPIRSQPVEEIERVLCSSDTVLQLTIEHDPENSTFKPQQRCRLSTDEPKAIKHASDTKSRIERKQLKLDETSKPNIPQEIIHSEEKAETKDDHKDVTDSSSILPAAIPVDKAPEVRVKERLFKRKGEANNSKGKLVRKRQTPESPLLGDKERSSSMSKLLDVVGAAEETGVLNDLSRARSFRVDTASNQRVFRAGDLLQGELLGCGFFGQVYRVTHRDTGEVMVLKQLYRVDEDAQRNFLKEVAVLRSLKHPNVLRFIGVLYKDKRLHLVTEFVAGGTLQQLLQEPSVTLCWATRARLARDIAAGVGYLHRMNVIHRDLNSHNCLVREDRTVIVADFGLARIVQRTASSCAERQQRSSTLSRRKRYTVVGNPYWMAPEMMKGNVYDEKVDVFSFGIILCEIIGRVQADPDFLPRRSDFGLNEIQFREKFCEGCPEPLCRLAFLCCDLNPDDRPPFEVMEIWLQSLVMHLSVPTALPPELLADIVSYQNGCHGSNTPTRHASLDRGHTTPECGLDDQRGIFSMKCQSQASHACCQHEIGTTCGSRCCQNKLVGDNSVLSKSKSNTTVAEPLPIIRIEETIPERNGRALGKCVSASQICQSQMATVTLTKLSRSQNTLNTTSGYILQARGKNINLTKVDDISEWVDPPTPLQKYSFRLKDSTARTRKIDTDREEVPNLPPFLRNQSVEDLESESKIEVDFPTMISRHFSIPNNCDISDVKDDTDASDDETDSFYQRVDIPMEVDKPKLVVDIVEDGKKFLKDADVKLRYPLKQGANERKIIEEDYKRYNIDHMKKNPGVTEGIKYIQEKFNKPPENLKEKSNFFTKKMLSPKLGRLFKGNTIEIDRKRTEEVKSPKLMSKFFVPRPGEAICKSYRIRPIETQPKSTDTSRDNSLDSDLKTPGFGKPLTPQFRRHTYQNSFQDGRFSCRDHRTSTNKQKFAEITRSRVISPGTVLRVDTSQLQPLSRCSNTSDIPALGGEDRAYRVALEPVKERPNQRSDGKKQKTKEGITRGNYVSLANLKINCKPKDLETEKGLPRAKSTAVNTPVERVI